jgi:hypothetical protein
MNSYQKSLCVSFGVIMCAQELYGQEKKIAPAVITATIEREGDDYFLHFVLAPHSEQTKTFYYSQLPWVGDRATIQLVGTKSRRQFNRKIAMVHSREIVEIPPGKQLDKRIRLNDCFDLGKSLMEEDIDVFWSAEAETLDGASLGRCGGWLLLTNGNRSK